MNYRILENVCSEMWCLVKYCALNHEYQLGETGEALWRTGNI